MLSQSLFRILCLWFGHYATMKNWGRAKVSLKTFCCKRRIQRFLACGQALRLKTCLLGWILRCPLVRESLDMIKLRHFSEGLVEHSLLHRFVKELVGLGLMICGTNCFCLGLLLFLLFGFWVRIYLLCFQLYLRYCCRLCWILGCLIDKQFRSDV